MARNTQYGNFKSGERVRVCQRLTAPVEEHAAADRCGTFVEYTDHGYARVRLDPRPEWTDHSPDVWLIHPENLQREEL